MHSMSNGNINQTALEAQSQRDQFVSNEMSDATAVYNAHGNSQAMFLFGLAMHPLMDMTSPAHTDPNGNPIPWCGLNPFSCSQLGLHGDMPQSIENVSHLNADPTVQEREDLILRSAFQSLTGRKLCCSH
jgi:hypothetical protein